MGNPSPAPILPTSHKKNDMDDRDFIKKLSVITRISVDDLTDFKPGVKDVRKQMSWAANRRTTRVEDLAYCLLM
jgi:hypothetical protein